MTSNGTSPPTNLEPADISVVIPTLNEEESVPKAIESAQLAGAEQIIVSDGGSSDRTNEVSVAAGTSKFIRSLPGRGVQLNAGAFFADRTYVLFLHADNLLGPDCLQQICEAGNPIWGCFEHQIDAPEQIYRWIEIGNAARARYRSRVFGDQGLFVRRDVFKREGGFAEIPLMEDVEFSERLRKLDEAVVLPGPIAVNARRWQQTGPVRQTLRNWRIQLAYAWALHRTICERNICLAKNELSSEFAQNCPSPSTRTKLGCFCRNGRG